MRINIQMNGIEYTWLAGTIGLNAMFYILLGMAVLILLLLILTIVSMVNVAKLKKRILLFTQGNDAKSLEQDIIGIIEDNKFLKVNVENNRKTIRELTKNQEKAFQKMGLVKYDAFQQMGGQLSFSLCLLDENNNGFIINSVHSTEGCYSYTKEIRAGESALDLGKEEEEALEIALKWK